MGNNELKEFVGAIWKKVGQTIILGSVSIGNFWEWLTLKIFFLENKK